MHSSDTTFTTFWVMDPSSHDWVAAPLVIQKDQHTVLQYGWMFIDSVFSPPFSPGQHISQLSCQVTAPYSNRTGMIRWWKSAVLVSLPWHHTLNPLLHPSPIAKPQTTPYHGVYVYIHTCSWMHLNPRGNGLLVNLLLYLKKLVKDYLHIILNQWY